MVKELESFLEKVKREVKVEKIILFGSRARGDNLKDSDVDLIIVSRDFEGVQFYERMSRFLLLWDAPLDLEVLCYTPEEFEQKSSEICVVREAIRGLR
jgi:hypothetical protein